MTNNQQVEAAARIALQAHAGQVDKAGEPYILHVFRVAAAGKTPQEQILGFLHDVLEDTSFPLSAIRLVVDDEIIQALAAITHEPGESDRAYAERCARNPLAKAVKLTDVNDNRGRLHKLSFEMQARLAHKYTKALEILEA